MGIIMRIHSKGTFNCSYTGKKETRLGQDTPGDVCMGLTVVSSHSSLLLPSDPPTHTHILSRTSSKHPPPIPKNHDHDHDHDNESLKSQPLPLNLLPLQSRHFILRFRDRIVPYDE